MSIAAISARREKCRTFTRSSVLPVMPTSAKMDLQNRALCYALRCPPKGVKKTKLKDIVKFKLVKKSDGTVPQPSAIAEAAATFKDEKRKRGRKQGWRKTTKSEDKQILTTFKKLRPPGYGVDSRDIQKALPKKLSKKVGRDTIISRLAEKGYTAQKKMNKSDNGVKWRQRRLKFAKKYKDWTPEDWKSQVQAVGDIKHSLSTPRCCGLALSNCGPLGHI